MKRKQTTRKDGKVIDKDGFEILGGAVGKEMGIGEVVTGVFGGVIRTMPARKKGGDPVPFYMVGTRSLLGGVVLRTRITEGNVKVGDTLQVTRLEDAPAKRGQNPAKIYDVRVKRV